MLAWIILSILAVTYAFLCFGPGHKAKGVWIGILLMLPVTSMLERSVGGSAFMYAAGLLVGACLGGNITPIGASCNVVACGVLERDGHPVSFWQFARIGLPFTLAATLFGYLFIWFVWGN